MPKPFPKEFRDGVVNVARNREPGQTIKQIAVDFGIAESCLRNWLRQADVEDGLKPVTTAADNAELREGKKRIRTSVGTVPQSIARTTRQMPGSQRRVVGSSPTGEPENPA